MGGAAAFAIFFGLIVLLVLLIWAIAGIRIVRPYEKGLIERLGKYQRTADSDSPSSCRSSTR